MPGARRQESGLLAEVPPGRSSPPGCSHRARPGRIDRMNRLKDDPRVSRERALVIARRRTRPEDPLWDGRERWTKQPLTSFLRAERGTNRTGTLSRTRTLFLSGTDRGK